MKSPLSHRLKSAQYARWRYAGKTDMKQITTITMLLLACTSADAQSSLSDAERAAIQKARILH
jgi:hypothetical protein